MSWIKTTEKLPTKEGFYLTFTPGVGRSVSKFYPDRKRFQNGFQSEVTHWAYLPKIPADVH